MPLLKFWPGNVVPGVSGTLGEYYKYTADDHIGRSRQREALIGLSQRHVDRQFKREEVGKYHWKSRHVYGANTRMYLPSHCHHLVHHDLCALECRSLRLAGG